MRRPRYTLLLEKARTVGAGAMQEGLANCIVHESRTDMFGGNVG